MIMRATACMHTQQYKLFIRRKYMTGQNVAYRYFTTSVLSQLFENCELVKKAIAAGTVSSELWTPGCVCVCACMMGDYEA